MNSNLLFSFSDWLLFKVYSVSHLKHKAFSLLSMRNICSMSESRYQTLNGGVLRLPSGLLSSRVAVYVGTAKSPEKKHKVHNVLLALSADFFIVILPQYF